MLLMTLIDETAFKVIFSEYNHAIKLRVYVSSHYLWKMYKNLSPLS